MNKSEAAPRAVDEPIGELAKRARHRHSAREREGILKETELKRESVVQPVLFKGCRNIPRMESGDEAHQQETKEMLDRMIRNAGFDLKSSTFYAFPGSPAHGFTYSAIIGESAITIHSWPEEGKVDGTVHICGGEEKIMHFLPRLGRLFKAATANVPPEIRMPH